MNTQLNIKTRLFSPSFVTLLIGIVVVLALSGPTIQAQTNTTTTTDTTVAPAGTVDSTITLQVKGTVNDPDGAFSVNGGVDLNCRRVVDTTSATTPTLVLLDFDFSQVTGTSGSLKTLKTYVTGGNHTSEIRPLQASDTIIITVPYYDSTKGPLAAKTMLISATLNFDVGTGKVTGGTISVGDNVVTKQTVGTVAPAQ